MTDEKRMAEARLVRAENRLHEFEQTLTGMAGNPHTLRRQRQELVDEVHRLEELWRRA